MYQFKLKIVSITMWLPDLEQYSGAMAQRIVDAMADGINRGELAEGVQLPPHRELADSLGLSVGTVSRAYAVARERGLIEGTVGRGTFVASRGDAIEEGGGEVDLSQNFIRWDPGESVAQLLREALRERTDLRTLFEVYADPAGRPEQRRMAARWFARRGVAAADEQVLITNGAQHGLLAIFSALTQPGELIAAEHLTYSGMKNIANQLGLRMAGLPMDQEGLLPEALDRLCANEKVRLLYTIPTVQNPTGALMSEDRRETIADIARRRKLTIVEDDIYSFLVDRPAPPIAAFAPERCYLVTSLSKSVFPGLRLGFVVCPPGQSESIAAMIRMSILTVSPVMAAIGTGWLEDGTAERIMEWKRREMHWRWQAAARLFGMDTRDRHPAAHLWLPVPESMEPEEFVARVRARGVRLAAADAFAVDAKTAPRGVRICLGTAATRAQLLEALTVIAGVVQGKAEPAPLI